MTSEEQNRPPKIAGDSVFFVRSSVASYWRGRTLEHFDGESWSAGSTSNDWVPSENREGVWFNKANLNRRSQALYQQTFYIRQDDLDSIYTEYSVLRISALDGSVLISAEIEKARGDSRRPSPSLLFGRLHRTRWGPIVGVHYLTVTYMALHVHSFPAILSLRHSGTSQA